MGKKNIIWNDYISQSERFTDFINGVLFKGEQLVSAGSLKSLDTKLWRRQRAQNSYHEYIRDTVKLWEYEGGGYIFDIEPEESPHYALPVKYMNYESAEYARQYKELLQKHRKKKDLTSEEYLSGFASGDRLMPVITIGIYLGEKPWMGCAGMSAMTRMKEIPSGIRNQLMPFWNEFHVNLLDIHTLEPGDIFRTDLQEVFGFLKRQGDKEELIRYVKGREGFQHLKEDAFDVLSAYSSSKKLGLRKEEHRTKEGMNMCTALDELEEEGREEGRLQGSIMMNQAMNQLISNLITEGRIEDLSRASREPEYQKNLMEEYGIPVLL